MDGWNAEERGGGTEGSSAATAEANGNNGVGVAKGAPSAAGGVPRTAAVVPPKGVGGKAAPGNINV